jgi:hypothetical protein
MKKRRTAFVALTCAVMVMGLFAPAATFAAECSEAYCAACPPWSPCECPGGVTVTCSEWFLCPQVSPLTLGPEQALDDLFASWQQEAQGTEAASAVVTTEAPSAD